MTETYTDWRRARGCAGKAVFPGKRQAFAGARRARRRSGEQIRPYECPDCGRWHIGHPGRGGPR